MSNTHRFQIDMTTEELQTAEQLGKLCGLRTKRELISNMLALFKWAATETLQGRTLCSLDTRDEKRILQMPALSHLAGLNLLSPPPTEEEIQRRLALPRRSHEEVMEAISKEHSDELAD